MDSTLVAAIIGACATIIAALIPFIINLIKKKKGILRGTIDQLIVPLKNLDSSKSIKELLPKAKEIRMCGWSLHRTIDSNRHILRELSQRAEIRILLLDPDSNAVADLDLITSDTDAVDRKVNNWPPVTPKGIPRKEITRTIEVLKDNNLISGNKQIVKFCKTLFPYNMTMIECEDGTGWMSLVMYPLHPDWRIENRLSFNLGNTNTELWRTLKEQFDAAWEDPHFSNFT